MRGGGGESAEQQDFTDAGRYLEHAQGMVARLVEKLRIHFGRIAAVALSDRCCPPRPWSLAAARRGSDRSLLPAAALRAP